MNLDDVALGVPHVTPRNLGTGGKIERDNISHRAATCVKNCLAGLRDIVHFKGDVPEARSVHN